MPAHKLPYGVIEAEAKRALALELVPIVLQFKSFNLFFNACAMARKIADEGKRVRLIIDKQGFHMEIRGVCR